MAVDTATKVLAWSNAVEDFLLWSFLYDMGGQLPRVSAAEGCHAFPFRMTARNVADHAGDSNLPFWEMLQAGSDAFSATERPPRVAVCDRRYVFNPAVEGDFDPSAPCPVGIDSTSIAGALQPSREISA